MSRVLNIHTASRRRYGRYGLGALLTALVVSGCGSSHTAATAPKPAAVASELRGLVPEPLPPKPSFTLTDTSGRPYNLTTATRGKLTYLFFGYTHCPDACPATMNDLAYAYRLQSGSVRRRIRVVFVTVDPRRDTGPVLRRWLDHYSRAFVGLTGSLHEIALAEEAAGVPPAPREPTRSANYSVAHSSILFAYSPDGHAHVVYAQGFKPSDYAHDMPLLLRFARSH
jgi:protein SCO1